MRVFVASWFFPPSTSSEGIVTYKLLRNSKHQYDVVSSSSNQWGYSETIENDAKNINVIPVDTDDLNEWRDETIRLFKEMHAKEPYDVFMTRCMPNESLEVGLTIKKEFPSVKWLCSLADPVANNPYWLHAIEGIQELSDSQKKQIVADLSLPKEKWRQDWIKHPSNSVRDQFYWKDIQDQALKSADVIITPSVEQMNYMDLDKVATNKFLIVPHSYDSDLYQMSELDLKWDPALVHFSFTGYSDALRSLNPFVEALKWIKDRYPEVLNKIKFHFFGNYPREIVDRAYAYQLNDVFDFQKNVSYADTLAIMKQSDWLLHMDAWFQELSSTGGSIFFAGKIADYIGANRPILALTGEASPAGTIVSQYGGIVCVPWNTPKLAGSIIKIALGEKVVINKEFAELFDARNVAASFDNYLESTSRKQKPHTTLEVIGKDTDTQKSLTISVPSYNSQETLARTLDSLLESDLREYLDIIVVDDGSSDNTFLIGKKYAEEYPDSVRLISKPNGGHGSGINVGLEYARGLYYRVVDSDDWVDSDGLSNEIDYILHHDELPDVIYTPYQIVDQGTGNSILWPMSNKIKFDKVYSFDELCKEVGVKDLYFTMAATTFKTDLLRKMNLQLEEKAFYTDSQFILKPIPFVKSAVFLKKHVYKYLRGQSEQSVAPLSFVRHYADHERVVKDLLLYEMNTDMDDYHRQYLENILNQHLITNYRILYEFDPDLNRGVEKAKAFDEWLKANAPKYYSWTEKNDALASKARSSRYDIEQIKKYKNTMLMPKVSLKSKVKRGIKKILHSPLFLNRFTAGYIRKQKDNNGWLYRAYKRLKK